MPQWISKDGDWKPRIEKVALQKANGEPYIYEGPDRAALEYLKAHNIESLGTHFTEDSDTIAFVRQKFGMEIKEYAKSKGWTPEKSEASFKEEFSKKEYHQEPKRSPATRQRSGGENTASTKTVESLSGGFGEKKEVK